MKIINFFEEKQTDVLVKEDLFSNLPKDIAIEILRRLPIACVIRCKCVCKSWRHLIEGDEFAMSFTPEPGLTFVHRDMDMGYTVRDEAFEPLFRFGPPSHIQSPTVDRRAVTVSDNGLLSAWDIRTKILFIFNPMTREYVELPPLSTVTSKRFYGFGVSKISRQFKILCSDAYSSCHVYTPGKGTGLWRSIAAPVPGKRRLGYDCTVFFNGNLHWLASDSNENFLVCCFDLETELFTSFSVPWDYSGNIFCNNRLYILEGRLYLCDILNWRLITIWRMNNYGDENSWTREYSFDLPEVYPYMYVLQVLANGDLLFAIADHFSMVPSNDQLYIYSKNTGDFVPHVTYDGFEQRYSSNIDVYTPTLISLTTLGFHDVQSLNFDCSNI